MTGPLASVTRAAQRRETAHATYLAAILRARAQGYTLDAIGHAAGVTRQAIHEMIRRHEREDRP